MSVHAMSRHEAARRREVERLGLWMFLATVTMLFAAFSSAYLVRRAGSDWSNLPLPTVLWVNTFALIASSGALEMAWRHGRQDQWTAAKVSVSAAIGLGLAFLAGQWIAWQELQRAGIYLPVNPSSSFFYMMTGAHALHVVAALAVLLWGAVMTWRHDHSMSRPWSATIGLCRTFWHFLLAVWLYLFAFVSLV